MGLFWKCLCPGKALGVWGRGVPACGEPAFTSLPVAALRSAVDLIRSGGKKLRFLVAKSDMEIAKKISSSSSSS